MIALSSKRAVGCFVGAPREFWRAPAAVLLAQKGRARKWVWSRAPPRPSDNGMRSAPGFCGLACTAAGRRRNCLAYDFMAWGRYELTAKRAPQSAEVSIYGIEYKEGIHPLLIHFGHPERLPESISRPRSSANFLCPSYRRDRTPRSSPGRWVES